MSRWAIRHPVIALIAWVAVLIGLVGAWLDRDLTADPVGSADAPDDDAHR